MLIEKKKGQMGLGTMIVVFVGIIVALTVFTVVAQSVGVTTSTVTVANKSLGAVAVNETAQYFTEYRSLTGVVIYNATGNVLVPSTNYTITNNVVYNGQEAVMIMPNYAPPPENANLSSKWIVSGTAEPLGYVGGASRSIALLIPLLSALAIAILALAPSFRNGLMEMLNK